MKTKCIVIMLLILLLVTGCSQAVKNGNLSISYTYSDESINDTVLMGNFKMFTFENNDSSLISRIDRVLKYSSKYYILDKTMKQVLSFDSAGNHVFTIHAIGNGAGEYSSVEDISIDRENGKLLLLVNPFAVLYYNLDGTYDNTLKLDGYYNSIANDEQYIYLEKATYVNNKLEPSSITVVDKSNHSMKDILDPLEEIAPYCHYQGFQMSFTNPPYFTRKFDDCIYSLAAGEVNPLYNIDWGKYSFPLSLRDNIYECAELNKLCWDQKYIYSISDIQETLEVLLFRTNIPGIYVLFKEGQEVKRYNMILNTELGIPLPNYMPVGGEEHEIFFIYPAHLLETLKQQTKNRTISSEASKLFESMNDDSNPVIFRYMLK